MKQKLVWLIPLVLIFSQLKGQTISPFLFGQNSWMPYAYGSQVYYGQLDKVWAKVKDSKVQMIRIGGIAPDFNRPTNDQYIALIDSIRKIGAEPIVQVPYGRGTYTATDAADIVTYLNVTMGRNVKYWSISNEPNLATQGYTVVPVSTVESYIKSFASAMKAVDPTILIAGPECAWYDAPYYNSLIGGANDITGQDANGRYYIDIVSFHSYPFGGTQSRSDVVNYPSGGLASTIASLLSLINNANTKNGRTGSEALAWAITEFNVNYQNPSSNTIDGVGVYSFLNGQFWAEYFGVGMANGAFAILPWSIQESAGNRTTYDLGYLDNNTTFIPRATYYHEQMMADNFKGSYITSTDNQSLVKTFASANSDQVAVMILNQDQANGYKYKLQLNTNTITGPPLVINVNAGINSFIVDSIPSQSSCIVVFDKSGTFVKKCIYSLLMASSDQAPLYSTQLTLGVDPGQGLNQNLLLNKSIYVIPNPASEKLTLSFNTPLSDDLLIIITNDIGKQVYSGLINSGAGLIEKTIDVSSWEKGLYVVNIKTGDKKYTQKVVVE